MLWWHWAIVGLGFLLAEMVLPAFVLLWFGLGALTVALVVAVMPLDLIWQLGIWSVLSLDSLLVWFLVFRNKRLKSVDGTSSAAIVGEVGMVVERVAPFQNGKVRFQKPMVGTDLWDCVSAETLEEGARVRVTRIEGTLLTVERVI